MDFDPTAIGLLAGTLTTIASIPQLIKSYKTKSTKDVSEPMLLLTCSGVFLWLIYGLFVNNLPLILTNVFTFLLWTAVLALKVKYDGITIFR